MDSLMNIRNYRLIAKIRRDFTAFRNKNISENH